MTATNQSPGELPARSPVSVVARSLDITPNVPVALASSPLRTPTTRVFEPLEANLLLLRHEGRGSCFWSRSTCCTQEPRSVRPSRRRWAATLAHVMVGASHTHYAPSTLVDKPGLGEVEPAYLTHLVSELRSAVRSMLEEPGEPVAFLERWRRGTRPQHPPSPLHALGAVKLAPNPAGPRDEMATVIAVGDVRTPSAVIWNYACHPVSHPLPGSGSRPLPRGSTGQPSAACTTDTTFQCCSSRGFPATRVLPPRPDRVAPGTWPSSSVWRRVLRHEHACVSALDGVPGGRVIAGISRSSRPFP